MEFELEYNQMCKLYVYSQDNLQCIFYLVSRFLGLDYVTILKETIISLKLLPLLL